MIKVLKYKRDKTQLLITQFLLLYSMTSLTQNHSHLAGFQEFEKPQTRKPQVKTLSIASSTVSKTEAAHVVYSKCVLCSLVFQLF